MGSFNRTQWTLFGVFAVAIVASCIIWPSWPVWLYWIAGPACGIVIGFAGDN